MRKSDEIILRPGGKVANYWRDIWTYRELFAFFAWRDVTVRYKQTVLGVAWAVIQPITTMLVFSLIFGRIARLPSDGIPYPVFVYAGVLPWQLFANALSNCSGSLVANANLIRKIYFPRMIVPASAIVVAVVDFLLAFTILGLLMIWYGIMPGVEVLMLPLFMVATLVPILAIGVWFAALNVKYRDFRFVIPFALQLGVFVSPVAFSAAIVPESYRFLYALNPMVGIINGYRWCLLGGKTPIDWFGFGLSMGLMILIFLAGVRYFRRVENSFADVV